VAGAI